MKMNEKIPMKNAYCCLVVFGAFLCYFIADGWSYSFGIFYSILIDYYGENRGKTAIIAALIYGLPLLMSPLICTLTDKLGCRIITVAGGLICSASFLISAFIQSFEMLFLSLGVFSSIGLSMTYVSSIICVSYCFDKHRGIATGLALSGSGVGSIAFPFIFDYLIQMYTWRGALLIFSALSLNISVAGIIFGLKVSPSELKDVILLEQDCCPSIKESAERIDENTDMIIEGKSDIIMSESNESSCIGKLCKICGDMDLTFFYNQAYTVFCCSSFVTYLWIGIPYLYLIDFALLKNISMSKAIFLPSLIAISRTCGQIILGFVGDNKKVRVNILYGISISLCGVFMLIIPFHDSYYFLCIVSVGLGFFVGATYCLQMMCLIEILGIDKSVAAFGIMQLVQGIATVLGTPVAGWLYDATHSYDYSFYISGSLVISSGLVLFIIPKLIKG